MCNLGSIKCIALLKRNLTEDIEEHAVKPNSSLKALSSKNDLEMEHVSAVRMPIQRNLPSKWPIGVLQTV